MSLACFKIVKVIALALVLAVFSRTAWAQEPQVGWAVDFEKPEDLAKFRIVVEGRSGNSTPPPELADVRVENGVLHLGVNDIPNRQRYD